MLKKAIFALAIGVFAATIAASQTKLLRFPDIYGDKVVNEHTGKDGGPKPLPGQPRERAKEHRVKEITQGVQFEFRNCPRTAPREAGSPPRQASPPSTP